MLRRQAEGGTAIWSGILAKSRTRVLSPAQETTPNLLMKKKYINFKEEIKSYWVISEKNRDPRNELLNIQSNDLYKRKTLHWKPINAAKKAKPLPTTICKNQIKKDQKFLNLRRK